MLVNSALKYLLKAKKNFAQNNYTECLLIRNNSIYPIIFWAKKPWISVGGVAYAELFYRRILLEDFFVDVGTETDKEVYRRELLNQPMWVQIAGLPCTVTILLSE